MDTSSDSIDIPNLLASLQQIEEEQAAAEEAWKAQLAHGRRWADFWRWCDRHGMADGTLPVELHVLAEWVSWAYHNLGATAFIETFAAIRERHVEAGHGEHLERLGA